MLLTNPAQNPETQRRQALAKVYALLIHVVDEKESAEKQVVDSRAKIAQGEPSNVKARKVGKKRRATSPSDVTSTISP